MPEIRFKGFSSNWETYPLATFISSLDAGVSVNSGDRSANENEFGILKTSCVTNGIFEPDENKVVFKKEEINRLKEPVLENTIIISRMNTPALVGANAYISRGYANYFLPDRLWAAKPTAIGDLKFIACILGSDKGRLALSDLATGTSGSMKNISKSAVLRLELRAPEEKEQAQIGNFFQKLDALINQHQQKYDKLSNIKKSMLEKMFPKQGKTMPEIRFKGFSGEWTKDKLGQVYNFQYGEFNINPSNGGQYPVYGANGIIGGYTHFNSQNSAVIGHMGEYAGSVLWAEGKHFVTYNGTIAKPKKSDFNPLFGFFSLVKMNLKKVCGGSGQPFLSYDALEKLDFTFPSEKEQTAIGSYFQKLDELIKQHQQQITKLNNIKQACLSKMFV